MTFLPGGAGQAIVRRFGAFVPLANDGEPWRFDARSPRNHPWKGGFESSACPGTRLDFGANSLYLLSLGAQGDGVLSHKRFWRIAMPIAVSVAAASCWDTSAPIRTGHGGPGVPAVVPHSADLGGTKHANGYCRPLLDCSSCHGDSLQGGSRGEPSCTSCHGANWAAADCGLTSHTANLGGSLHMPSYCLPYQNCTQCHGAALRGGTGGEPSCLSCHTQTAWMSCGGTSHATMFGGVMHAVNPCAPLASCILCHGSSLGGGPNGEPSCYSCHGDRWTDCGD